MKGLRLSLAAWQLLQRLGQDTAALVFLPDDGRFYFTLHDRTVDLVRQSTIDALSGAGLIRREKSTAPWYSISERGREAIQERVDKAELLT
jgi:hypothetical protein